MNQEPFFEDPLPKGSQATNVVAWIKREMDSLRAYIDKVAERPRERVINIYGRSDGLDESLLLSLSRIGNRLESVELSGTQEDILDLDLEAESLWNTILDDYGHDEALRDYSEWKEDNEGFTFDELKARQKQEVYRLLTSGFFRHYQRPTGAAVKNRRLTITEDDLEVGTRIPKSLPSECAKFEKFVEWRGEHLIILNYEKLENYIRKNQNQMNRQDMENIAAFDMRLDMIQDDMVALKPEEAKNQRDYEKNNVMEILNECADILNTCQHLLKDGIRKSIMKELLDKMLFDDKMKAEARRKLGKRTKAKYLCEIMAAISNCYVFKPGIAPEDLAQEMRRKLTSVAVGSIKTYIVKAAGDRHSDLQQWTTESITELKDHPYNPLSMILTT